ncbi:hypothetical protein [Finegoldia magna]|uniref:hypothetical protein n=1 Tax=Finegoldia magna TaxID=1260 RepID=UPI00280493A1|nr:hypothetical protein [Finegoldia magna]MDU1400043.1 hypothetical protein [Finegoldia magna]
MINNPIIDVADFPYNILNMLIVNNKIDENFIKILFDFNFINETIIAGNKKTGILFTWPNSQYDLL